MSTPSGPRQVAPRVLLAVSFRRFSIWDADGVFAESVAIGTYPEKLAHEIAVAVAGRADVREVMVTDVPPGPPRQRQRARARARKKKT